MNELKKAIEENEELYKLLDIIWKVKEEVCVNGSFADAIAKLDYDERNTFIDWWKRND